MTKAFPIRNKPSKPVRLNNVSHEKNVAYSSLQDLVDLAKEWGAPWSACEVELEYGGGYQCDCSVIFSWSGPEPIELFRERMDKYEKGCKSYDAWYKENKDEIDAELARRKEVKADAVRYKAQQKVNQLAAELAKNQRKLEAMS